MKDITIALCAGEASGDKLAAELVEELRGIFPQIKFYGIGGEKMRAAGVECVADYQPLAVMGYKDVLLSLPAIMRLRRQFLRQLTAVPPAIFIGIDAPDFNLGLARILRRQGSYCVQYVAPSVWMWRRKRLAKIAAAIDAVLCLLPFEKPLYTAAGIAAYYVGHPAARRQLPDSDTARRRLNLSAALPVIALLPGSRSGELAHHLPLMQQVMEQLGQQQYQFIAAATDRTQQQIQQAIPQVVCTSLENTVAAADIAIVKSGTAALETALAQVPLLVFYRPSRLAAWLVRWRRFYLPFFSLPNILSRRFVAAEMLLEEANADNIVRESRRLLQDEQRRGNQQRQFAVLGDRLRNADISAAAAIADIIREKI